jgi:lysophospholipase L1-like esterase
MHKKFLLHLLLVFFLGFAGDTKAQQPPYWKDIQAFKKQDSLAFPPKNAILFVGSSSFTNWKDVQSYFPNYKIINRGFGGSELTDVIRYANDIIFPYHPKQVVIYCGENDFADVDTVSVPTVVNRFKTLYGLIRKNLGNVQVTFVSLKPSPSRRRLMPKFVETNALIKSFLAKEKNTAFIDVYHPMLAKDGQPIKEIFRADSLHMMANGYVIWQKIMEPYLIK